MNNAANDSIVAASQSGPISAPTLSSGLGWNSLGVLLLGWLSGFLFHMLMAAVVGLPTYEVIVKNSPTVPSLSLKPMSRLDIALVPRENTTLLPHLCGYTSDGSSLTRWPVAHRLAHGGTVFIEGEVRDLLPLPALPAPAPRELVFVLSGSFSFCQPRVLEALHALDRWTETWSAKKLPHALSSLLGIQTLRLPVSFPYSRD